MDIWGVLGTIFSYSWWLIALLILAPLTADTWRAWRQKHFEEVEIKWMFMEIHIPRDVKKSPKAMEQIFMQLYSMKNIPHDLHEIWWQGEVPIWYTFEIVALKGEVHFFMRIPTAYRKLVEAAFFAYYPDVELVEVRDYMKQFPPTIQDLYREGMVLWGTELILAKPGAYPIRNYEEFENSLNPDKEYDPMSAAIEIFSKLDPDQFAGIQFHCAPAVLPHDLHQMHEYHELVREIRDRKHEPSPEHTKAKLKFTGILPTIEPPSEHEDALSGGLRKAIMSRTPGEITILEAIEDNIGRPMFTCVVRYIYFSPEERYSEPLARRAIYGAFNQYGAENINAFVRNEWTQTRTRLFEWPFIFPKHRLEYRRQRIYHDYRHREVPPHQIMGRLAFSSPFNIYWGSKTIHLNTRSLATVFHLPTYTTLTGPHIKRVDSRKAGPQAGIGIFGEESDLLERFE